MRHAKWETLPDDVRAVYERFEAWRQSRSNRSRVPADLWIAATELARRHGVHRVARALGLNDTALKQRTLAAAPGAPQAELLEQPQTNETPAPTGAPEPPEQEADSIATPSHAAFSPVAPGNVSFKPLKPAATDNANSTAGPAPLTPLMPPAPAFIQLPWPALAANPRPACCVVELLRPGGNRMIITLHDSSGAGAAAPPALPGPACGLDLAALVRAFWSQSP